MRLKRKDGHRKEKRREDEFDQSRIRKSCWIFNFGKVFEACSHSLGNTCIAGDFDVTKVLPTQVPPRGGSCIWGPTG
ncbi:hypothetical protein V1477_000518 [Vespula maculifrons]|uniref:Uncharacterized protein n=1 Tax=Vespula maculifrons TaxID=7453 RepID=A0ABD2D385_VESMC